MKNPKQLITLTAVVAMCGVLLASCGGGSGGGSSTTTINGISVPPEPDPVANNATLAGVDSNNNGVRDDAERKIAQSSNNADLFNAKMALAKIMQADLLGADVATYLTYAEAVCHIYLYDSQFALEPILINNDDRESAFSKSTNYRETPSCN
jgi:hypothetical protein